jgi:2,4-diaminopentanoate dehydrogenase
MRAPYRVAVWGPGDVGSICLREAIRLPELEVVGALAYSEAKAGQDIGTIIGVDPIGITATSDVDAFLELDCDVVLHTALDYPGADALTDYVRLLEAGKNVITSHPYNNLDARGPEFRERLTDAAQRGGATFHATGANPDFVAHRLMMTLTGFSNDIKQIKIEEYFDCIDQANPGILQVIGLGGDPDQAMDANSPALWYQQQYWFQMIEQLAGEMGVELSRIEATSESVPARHRLESPVLTIEPGRTGNVAYESIGYVGDQPFIRMRVGWYLTEEMKPTHVTAPCQWIFSIEGRPSTKTVLSVEPTLTNLNNMAGEPAAPGYVGFGVTLIQAIPAVVAAPPGIKPTGVPPIHWRRDMRVAEPQAAAWERSATSSVAIATQSRPSAFAA